VNALDFNGLVEFPLPNGERADVLRITDGIKSASSNSTVRLQISIRSQMAEDILFIDLVAELKLLCLF
jgi:hypothetical protein